MQDLYAHTVVKPVCFGEAERERRKETGGPMRGTLYASAPGGHTVKYSQAVDVLARARCAESERDEGSRRGSTSTRRIHSEVQPGCSRARARDVA